MQPSATDDSHDNICPYANIQDNQSWNILLSGLGAAIDNLNTCVLSAVYRVQKNRLFKPVRERLTADPYPAQPRRVSLVVTVRVSNNKPIGRWGPYQLIKHFLGFCGVNNRLPRIGMRAHIHALSHVLTSKPWDFRR